MEYLRSAVKRITGKRPPPDEDRIRTPTVQAVVTQSSSDIEDEIPTTPSPRAHSAEERRQAIRNQIMTELKDAPSLIG